MGIKRVSVIFFNSCKLTSKPSIIGINWYCFCALSCHTGIIITKSRVSFPVFTLHEHSIPLTTTDADIECYPATDADVMSISEAYGKEREREIDEAVS